MKIFGPDECCKFLNKNLDEIKISDLRVIAELERPSAYKYHDFVDRSSKEREEDVVKGKHGELIVMTALAKFGYKILVGVTISEQNDPPNPDDGTDFKIELSKNKQGIQVKSCEGYFNVNSEHQEDLIKECFKKNTKILICHHLLKSYKIRYLTENIFNDNLLDSTQDNGYKYIMPSKIPEFTGQF